MKLGDFALLSLLSAGCFSAGAQSELSGRNVALLIGVDDYGGAQLDLYSPPHDLAGMEAALFELGGFETMTVRNPDRTALVDAILAARARAQGGVVLFYFSGHALSLEGVNYLLPARAAVRNAGEVPLHGVSVQQVLGALEGARLRLLILDACRSNAFAVGSKALGRGGLSRDNLSGYEGTLVSYAAAPGSVAYDGGEGEMSPFTKALVNHLPRADIDLVNLFIRVRGELRASTSHLPQGPQRSEEINSLLAAERLMPVRLAATAGEKVLRTPPTQETSDAPMPVRGERKRESGTGKDERASDHLGHPDHPDHDDAVPLALWFGVGGGLGLAAFGGVVALLGVGVATYAEVLLSMSAVSAAPKTLALNAGLPAAVVGVVGGAVLLAGLFTAAASASIPFFSSPTASSPSLASPPPSEGE